MIRRLICKHKKASGIQIVSSHNYWPQITFQNNKRRIHFEFFYSGKWIILLNIGNPLKKGVHQRLVHHFIILYLSKSRSLHWTLVRKYSLIVILIRFYHRSVLYYKLFSSCFDSTQIHLFKVNFCKKFK